MIFNSGADNQYWDIFGSLVTGHTFWVDTVMYNLSCKKMLYLAVTVEYIHSAQSVRHIRSYNVQVVLGKFRDFQY